MSEPSFLHTVQTQVRLLPALLLVGAAMATLCLDSCRHHRNKETVIAEPVAAGAPITVYYCDQPTVRLWLENKLSFEEHPGIPLDKKEAKAVRSCIQTLRTSKLPWPESPADAASGSRYLFVSEGRVVFSIFQGKELVQYPLSQTNPALWAKTQKTLSRKLNEAAQAASHN